MFLVSFQWRLNEEGSDWEWNVYTFQKRHDAEDSYDRLKSYDADHGVLYTKITLAQVIR